MAKILPSWNDAPAKQAILDFVAVVTDENNPNYVPPAERIAVFDNDGTLWCEKPMYIQLDYLLRKLAIQAESDETLRTKQPWKAAWEKDFDWLGSAIAKHYQGDDSILHVLLGGIIALSDGIPVEQVEAESAAFVKNEKHPTLEMTYENCVYQPMLELLDYLESKNFINYIVSGGGRDFMRGFAEERYGVPRERVIGSTVAYRYKENNQVGEIVQKAELDVIDDGPAKPVQIWNVIGRRPILVAGNSNGDLAMMTFAGKDALSALRILIVHDDAEREFEYIVGAEKVISTAKAQGWTSISMKEDFIKIFPDPNN